MPKGVILAAEIIEYLEAALDQFRGVVDGLESRSKESVPQQLQTILMVHFQFRIERT